MQRHFKTAAIAAAVLSTFNVYAAEEARTPEVVVTATRQPMRANELLADVTVLDEKDIQEAGQSTLTELLARQPGIQMSSNGGAGTTASIFIRGANDNHTLVLIDGMRVSSATSGTTNLANIPLAEIERIEILRGPASALYGSDAIGGVIQIFTRRGSGAPRFDAFVGVGSYGTREADAGYSGSSGDLSYSFRAGVNSTDSFSATNSQVAFGGFNPDDDSFTQRHASANAAYKLGASDEIGANVLYSKGFSHYDSGPGFDDRAESRTSSAQAYLKHRFTDQWLATFKAGQSTDDNIFISAFGNSVFRTNQDQFSWQNDVKLPLGQAIVAYDFDKQNVTSDTSYTVKKRIVNSWLIGWNANVDRNGFQINVRHDDNSQFGGKTTGLGSYGFQWTPELRTYVSVGTAFSAPTFNQLYYPGFGNASLEPEFARNREAGIVWDTAKQNASLIMFSNKVDNLITGFPAINTKKATLEGATISYGQQMGEWDVKGSVDLMQGRDDITHKQLRRRADQSAQFSIGYRYGAWHLGSELSAAGLRYDDVANTPANRLGGYNVVNAFANYTICPEWRLELRANNLGDKDYTLAKGYNTPGRNLFAGLRYSPK
jgi:vitamin B12 transporter